MHAMTDIEQVVELLKNKSEVVGMLAPSFPVMYKYPDIVGKLKRTGFGTIVEVTAGAKRTNEQVVALLQADPNTRFITSPCPGFVRYVRAKHPNLIPFLAFKADSPMIASARIVKEKYPTAHIVFIGPCVAKKKESSEDYPELNIHVITYRELETIFTQLGIQDSTEDAQSSFDISEASTRIYPTDGGLTDTSGARTLLSSEQVRVVSGWKQCEAALQEFESDTRIRLLDILYCEGGCVNGPGVVSTLTLDERIKKVKDFAATGAT